MEETVGGPEQVQQGSMTVVGGEVVSHQMQEDYSVDQKEAAADVAVTEPTSEPILDTEPAAEPASEPAAE